MELEGEVDVYNSVKAIKLRRPQIIDTLVMIYLWWFSHLNLFLP